MKKNKGLYIVFFFYFIVALASVYSPTYFLPMLGLFSIGLYFYFKYYVSVSQTNLNSIRRKLKESDINSTALELKTGISRLKIDLLREDIQYSEQEINILCKELGIIPKKKTLKYFFIYLVVVIILIWLVYFLFSEQLV